VGDRDARFCGGCGGPLAPGSRFCGSCGRGTATSEDGPDPAGPVGITQPERAAQPTAPLPTASVRATHAAEVTDGAALPPRTGAVTPVVDRDRRRRRMFWGIGAAVVAVVGGAVVAILLLRPSATTRTIIIDGPQSAGVARPPTTGAPSTTSTTDGVSAVSPPSAGQSAVHQAQSLESLLQNSTSDRSATVSATADVATCGNLAADVQTLRSAASGRQELLAQLSQLDLTALPGSSALTSTLTGAWQSSIQSDMDYASWATDLEQSGCAGQVPASDPNWQSAQRSDTSATFTKYEFVALWNPVAQSDGLTQYQYGQL